MSREAPGTRRLEVRSADGTALAVWVEGAGPPIVLVHGSLSDHTTFEQLAAELGSRMTVYAMDRRGYGASSDTAPYSLDREFEDVAAVVEAAAIAARSPVSLWGHSFGGSCAMGAARLTTEVDHVLLYEPSLGLVYPAGQIESIERAAAADDRDALLVAVLDEILELSAGDIDSLRRSRRWPVLRAGAPLVPRECRAEESWVYHSGQFGDVTAEALLLVGSDSPEALVLASQEAARALPRASTVVLEGHSHLAHKSDPTLVARVIDDFVSGGS